MDNFFDNKRILASIWKWKIHILAVIGITTIASAIISGPMFIKPKFKSTARIYPVNLTEASKESESEHLLEYVQSHDTRFRIIDAFKLDSVYKISKSERLYQTWMLYEYEQNISYKKTEFETIEIKVLDEDPQRACDIVDSIIVFTNEAIQKQQAIKYLELAEVAKRDLDKKTSEIDSLFNLVEAVRKETGLVDYYSQSTTATRGLLDAAALGGDIRPAKEVMANLVEKGGVMRRNQEMMKDYEIAADTLKKRYDKALSLGTQKLSYSKVVVHPFPADKKSYPIRWLIVFLSVVTATLISFITVSLIDYFGENKTTL